MKPDIDEFYEAFISSVLHNLPSSVQMIGGIVTPYISKIKEDIYMLVGLDNENKIYLDIDNNKINNLIVNFTKKQGFIARNILKPIMKSNYIDNIDNFILSVKEGKNKYDKTINSLTNIFSETFEKLAKKYQTSETKETIKTKVEKIFI